MNLAKQALTVGVWAAAVITRFAYQASKIIILSWHIFSNRISLEKNSKSTFDIHRYYRRDTFWGSEFGWKRGCEW